MDFDKVVRNNIRRELVVIRGRFVKVLKTKLDENQDIENCCQRQQLTQAVVLQYD